MLSAPVSSLKRFWSASPANRAFVVALGAVIPLLVWWMGWFPGLLTSDSLDQFSQARSGDINNTHPAIHTLLMQLIIFFWDTPGAVTLVQVLAVAGVLALVARRLADIGVPWQLAAGAALFASLLPAVGATSIALWKDVPYTLALLWAASELLVLVRQRRDGLAYAWPLIRLGVALGAMWVFRHNGFLTVMPFLAMLAWWGRAHLRRVGIVVAAVAAVVIGVNYVLYPLAGVERRAIEPATVFISDVAASLRHEPSNFSTEELAYLDDIAPLTVWQGLYDCLDSTPLVFSEAFDLEPIRADPGRFQSLVASTYLRDPDTVLGHRWCAASYLLVPGQPADGYFQRPPFVLESNELGLVFDPVWQPAQDLTLRVVRWSEPPQRLWLTWRPALAIWLGIATFAAIAWRRRLRSLLIVGGLGLAQMANVALTTPAQEFRFAFGLYLMGILSAPLLWLVARPGQARVWPPETLRLGSLRVGR